MNLRQKLISALVATAVLGIAPLHAATKEAKEAPTKAASPAAATVNGKAISQARVEMLAAAQRAQGRPDSDELRKAIVDNLITQEVLSQEALKKGVDKKPEVQTQIELSRQEILINAYIGDYVRSHPVADDAIKAEYDKFRASMGDKEYKARHILVEKEEDAKAILTSLKKGEKFADLAKQSKDPGSKDKGGDLDWSVPGNYVKPFADALAKLEKGKYTETPVKTDFGWHIILLEDTRAYTPPALDDLKPQITQNLQRQIVLKHVQELRAKAKVE